MSIVMWEIAYPGMRIVAEKSRDGYAREGHPAAGTFGTCIAPGRYRDFRARYGFTVGDSVPGIYEQDGNWMVLWDGADAPVSVDTYNVRVHDDCRAHYDMRYQGLWVKPFLTDKVIEYTALKDQLRHAVRLGPLPKTKFWEGDIVRPSSTSHIFDADNRGLLRRVSLINYHWVVGRQGDERGMCYQIDWIDENGEYARAGHTNLHDVDLVLVERGNVWKHYHNEPKVFNGIREEIGFAHGMCQVEQMRNPETGNYGFDKDSALKAIQIGYADHFKLSAGLFGSTPTEQVYRCKDRDLGERVRAETLKGFGLEPIALEDAVEAFKRERGIA